MRRTCLGCLLVQRGWGTVVQTKMGLISCSPSQLTRPRLAKLQATQRHVSKTSMSHCQVGCCVWVACHRTTVVKANWNSGGYWCKCREFILVSPVGESENIKEGSEEDEGSLTKGRGRWERWTKKRKSWWTASYWIIKPEVTAVRISNTRNIKTKELSKRKAETRAVLPHVSIRPTLMLLRKVLTHIRRAFFKGKTTLAWLSKCM